MKIVAGVDGGATYTRVALATTSGKLLGLGTSGPSNYGSVPKDKIKEHIENSLQKAFKQANIKFQKLDGMFLGMAGIVSHNDRETIRYLIRESDLIKVDNVEVDHDIRISLAGGLAGKEGIALIVGTGSSCYGRSENGLDWMAGGWGHLIDDCGSAYDFGLRGLAAIVRAADGRGPQTSLTNILMQELGINSIEEIIYRVHVAGPSGKPMDKKAIASLATHITKAAENGDQVAINIIQQGIHELIVMVKAVLNQLAFNTIPVPLIITGGTYSGSLFLQKKLFEELTANIPEVKIEKQKLTPLKGSVLLALRLIGINNLSEIMENLTKSDT